MHCCLFTQTRPLLSSGCAKLILFEALTLSWTTNVRWSCGERTHPVQLTIHCTVWSQHTISQISPAMKKERGREEGKTKKYACIKFNTFVSIETIQHVIHLSSHIRADAVHCLGPGEHGCLEQTHTPHPAPLSPSDQHPGHLPHCYIALPPVQLILYFTNHMTDDHHGLKRRNGDNAMQY